MNLNEALARIVREKGIIKFVDIGASSLNKGVLQTAKLNEFIQAMKEATVLLDAARLIPMESFSKDIDRIDMEIDLEAPVRDPVTGNITLSDQDPEFGLNNLDAVLLKAKTRLTQEAIEDNIQGNTLPSTLTSLFGAAGGRSLEKIFIYGDTAETGGTVPTGYKAVDGWIKKTHANNKFYGGGTTSGRDFDPDDIDDIFTTLYDAQNRAYLSRSIYFVAPQRASQYRRSLKSRDTDLGDQANLQAGNLTFEGRPVVEVPALAAPLDDGTFFGPEAVFFGPAANFVYGMWKTVTIRSDEDVENDMWKFFLRLRGDCHFENEKNLVLGLPSETAP